MPDPYSLKAIEFTMTMRSKAGKFLFTPVQKQLHRLGDRVAVGLIKLLDEESLTDPRKAQVFLPIIRDAFAYPQLITTESDKKPRVTKLLLKYLSQNITDTDTQREIQEIITALDDL